eukprot:m.168129 g.168129  ORF g.168129 m.168129 type:complete len:400 (-) comp21150_c0_seq3:93-1292(-)
MPPLSALFLLLLCTAHASALCTNVDWLTNATMGILAKCAITAKDGTLLFTPDASLSYGAQWTRDFYYAVNYAPLLFPNVTATSGTVLQKAISVQVGGVRADGCAPDRVQGDLTPVYGPGPASSPMADHAWDNGPFLALLATSYLKTWPNDKSTFCSWLPTLDKALRFTNISSIGLVYNNPAAPNCTYGFTDTVAKSGHLLFTSILVYQAAEELLTAVQHAQCPFSGSAFYQNVMANIKANIMTLKDPNGALLLAASEDDAEPDVWGSALALHLNILPASVAQGVADYLALNTAVLYQEGQVRSLPSPKTWSRCFSGCPAPGTYQNGGFWATPHAWLLPALANNGYHTVAANLLNQTLSNFQTQGVMEWVNTQPAGSGARGYVASATNTLAAAHVLRRKS